MVDGTTGKQFSTEYQPQNRGRKRSVLNKFVKDNGVSIQDVRLVFQNLIVRNLAEVRQLNEQAEDLPAIVGFTVSALLKDYEAGKLDTLNSILDRVWGKPTQQLEIDERCDAIPNDPEWINARLETLKKELEELNGNKAPPALRG
jgi:hypothetical protein